MCKYYICDCIVKLRNLLLTKEVGHQLLAFINECVYIYKEDSGKQMYSVDKIRTKMHIISFIMTAEVVSLN
jgi:hypothetical protein